MNFASVCNMHIYIVTLHICVHQFIHCTIWSKQNFTHSLLFSSHFSFSSRSAEDSAGQAAANGCSQQDTSNEASNGSPHNHPNMKGGTGICY